MSEKIDRTGEKKLMNCGFEAEIIEYRSFNDIDVKFSNGLIRRHVRYKDFIIGKLSIKPLSHSTSKIDSRLHEKKLMKCGLGAEIINYKNARNIIIRFDNGEIKHTNYSLFCNGTVVPDSIKSNSKLITKLLTKAGIEIELINIINSRNIRLRFSDGEEKIVKSLYQFKRGEVEHSTLKIVANYVCSGSIFANFNVNKLAYKQNDGNVYYICKCQKCGLRDILNPQEMLAHKCQK